ncbi:MAG: copper resistance protein CopC, partial [Gemmatimonadetes bacterium]|nr:copper resistance protein CopC [Gemmatimonadota bacterium]
MRILGLSLLIPGLLGATALHTALESSAPSDGDSLEAPPTEVRLEYTTDVQLDLSRVRVLGPAGEWAIEGLRYLAEDRHDVLVAPLPVEQPSGAYRVLWTTAGPDGHAIHGEFEYEATGS